jgi:Stage II sporulation protein M
MEETATTAYQWRQLSRVVRVPPAQVSRWVLVSFLAATCLLLFVLAVAVLSAEYRQVPVSGPPFVAGSITDAMRIFGENCLVLALYVAACLSVFVMRRHRRAPTESWTAQEVTRTRLATSLIIGLLLVAVCRQAYVLGHGLAGFSAFFYVNRWRLWLAVLPHAIPELTAMLLPVAAWFCASRKGELDQLAAVTVSALLVALPLLASASLIEVYVSPKAFRAVTCIQAKEGFTAGTHCGTEEECPKLSRRAFEEHYGIHLGPGSRQHCRAVSRSH